MPEVNRKGVPQPWGSALERPVLHGGEFSLGEKEEVSVCGPKLSGCCVS